VEGRARAVPPPPGQVPAVLTEGALDQGLLSIAIAAAIGIAVGFLLGSRRQDLLHERLQVVRERERVEADQAVVRLRREIVDMTARNAEQAEAFQLLPDVVRDMFAARTRRALLPLMMKLVDMLFRPEQIAIFVARPTQRRLALAERHGLPTALPLGFELDYGQGRVGYVAATRVAMDDADFKSARGEKTRDVAEVQAQLRLTEVRDLRSDAVAPVVEGDHVFAVVSVGGARTRRGYEKRLLTMVTGIAAAALVNVTNSRAAEEASGTDGMTGLFNRKRLEDRLDEQINKADRDGVRLSVLMIDIDHFRHYNETNGLLQGDDLLRQLATLLRGAIRADDLLARYAGEEFVVVYPGADKDTALRLADQLRATVEAYPFPFRGLQPGGALTISGGVATYPQDSKVGRDLLRQADEALYDAKAEGRNRINGAMPNYLT
jgi:diguanylate cyclase (GGDEF)-like protein